MTADIVNLRQARKARDRVAKDKRAEENRARFGRTKVEKLKARGEAQHEGRRLDGHLRDAPPEVPPDHDPAKP